MSTAAMAAAIPPSSRALATPQSTTRIESIDFLRGLVMIIMALDHVRDFFHVSAFTADPLNLQTTTPALFLTRWITHFCAPVFVFLSGTSIYLQGLRKTKKELSLFLFTRGLWLIAVEWLVMSLVISFDPGYSNIFLQVIWAIGISMVLLAGLIWLPFPVILFIGLVIVFGHNLLDYSETGPPDRDQFLYNLMHRPQFGYTLWPGHQVHILYPFLPWTGVMMLGYCLGNLFRPTIAQEERRKMLAVTGGVLMLLFVFLRWFNGYGDPLRWSGQESTLFTVFSFINTQKYPPSLLFLCMTIGPALLLLSLAGGMNSRLARVVAVYGMVPFFYYILHFFLAHAFSAIAFFLRGHSFAEGVNAGNGIPFNFIIPNEGMDLPGVYIMWIVIVLLLYPACRWYSAYKKKHRKWWLSYL